MFRINSLSMSRRDFIINKIIEKAIQKEPSSEIYLYGSRARGKGYRNSDWDILVLVDKTNLTFEYETELMDNFYDIELETGEVISPLIYNKEDWNHLHQNTPLFNNIQREGIRLK